MKREKAYPFPTRGQAPYLQAFLVTMESGAVFLARVMGEDRPHGQGLAHAAAQELEPGRIWADSPYPVGPEEQAKGPGLDVLKAAPAAVNTCQNCRFWGAYMKGECDRVGGLFSDNPAASFDIRARVLDDSGLTVGLATGPDFSCLHFMARKPRKASADKIRRNAEDVARAIGPKYPGDE